MGYFIFAVLLSGLIIISFLLSYFIYGLQEVSVSPELKEIKISRGQGLQEISSLLFKKGIIRSELFFKLYSFFSGSAHLFKPGFYKLSSASTTPEIASFLAAGSRREISVTIPEGATVKEIERSLAESGILKERELSDFSDSGFLARYDFQPKSLEGFLFPDTYYFEVDSDVKTVIGKFLDNFEKRAWPFLKERGRWFDSLILASILEKEVSDFEERRLVAGLIEKRIKNFRPIQVDAALVYYKCGGDFTGCSERLLTKSDFNLDNPFNTYKKPGLPPSPIANPGEAAVKAALKSQPSSYWYYLSDRKTGKTYFSKTFEEHNDYRAKYLGL